MIFVISAIKGTFLVRIFSSIFPPFSFKRCFLLSSASRSFCLRSCSLTFLFPSVLFRADASVLSVHVPFAYGLPLSVCGHPHEPSRQLWLSSFLLFFKSFLTFSLFVCCLYRIFECFFYIRYRVCSGFLYFIDKSKRIFSIAFCCFSCSLRNLSSSLSACFSSFVSFSYSYIG